MDRQVEVSLLSGEHLALLRLPIADGSTLPALVHRIVLRQLRQHQNGRRPDSAHVVRDERDRDDLIRFDPTVHVLLSSESLAQVRLPDNVLSIVEPRTEAIRRRKADEPTELGKLLTIQEAEHQTVTALEVHATRPAEVVLWTPALHR